MNDADSVEGLGFANELAVRLRSVDVDKINPTVDVREGTLRPLPSLDRSAGSTKQRSSSPEALRVADAILSAERGRSTGVGTTLPNPPAVLSPPRQAGPVPVVATFVGPDNRHYGLSEGVAVVIGRVPGDGGIAVANSEISRRHVQLEVRNGALLVTELGSTNGTTLARGSAVFQLQAGVGTALNANDRLLVNGDICLCAVTQSRLP